MAAPAYFCKSFSSFSAAGSNINCGLFVPSSAVDAICLKEKTSPSISHKTVEELHNKILKNWKLRKNGSMRFYKSDIAGKPGLSIN
jgi:hypothetical protein